MIHKWYEIKLDEVKVIKERLALARLKGWNDDIGKWLIAQTEERGRYQDMLTARS